MLIVRIIRILEKRYYEVNCTEQVRFQLYKIQSVFKVSWIFKFC